MTDVFISYSSRHRALTERLARYLASKGLGVWWDEALEARGEFKPQLHGMLQAASAVIVIWTTDAINSKWVLWEASEALRRNKLINVEPNGIDRSMLPEPFRDHHRHVQSDLRDIDMERIFSDFLAVRDGKPLPRVVPEREQYEKDYAEPLLDTKRLPLPATFEEVPSLLLQAKYGVVGYVDHHGVLAQLLEWAQGKGTEARRRAAAGRLIHGAGGLGKSRLMIEMCAALRELGWSAGFLGTPGLADSEDKRRRRANALAQLISDGDDNGVCVVIDYAEGRRDDVRTLAASMRAVGEANPRRPVLLVLLTRELGEWWETLRADDPAVASMFSAGLGRVAEVALPQTGSGDHRLRLFDEALQRFSQILAGRIAVNPASPNEALLARIKSDADYERPLAVLIAALLHVYSIEVRGSGSGLAVLLDQAVDLELGHWRRVRPDLTQERRKELQRGVIQLTLVLGVGSRAEAGALLAEDGYYRSRRPDPAACEPIVRDISQFYGDNRGGLGWLEPDLIGERLMLREAAWDLDHALTLVDACLTWRGAQAVRWRQTLTLLNRATRPDHGTLAALARALLVAVARRYTVDLATVFIDVALAEPEGALPEALIEALPGLGDDALAALDSELPFQSIRLVDLSLALAELRLHRLRVQITATRAGTGAGPAEEFELVKRLVDQGVRLEQAGRFENALAASQEGAARARSLLAAQAASAEPQLVACLTNASAAMSELGRREEALVAVQEAMAIARRLFEEAPEKHRTEFVGCCMNLGKCLSEVGRHEEAPAAIQEAIDTLTASPVKKRWYRAQLASLKLNLSFTRSSLGQHDEALASSSEAVGELRRLAEEMPDTYAPDLAMCLITRSKCLMELNRMDEAVRAAEEAVTIYRPLARVRPEAHSAPYALALNNLAAIHSLRGDPMRGRPVVQAAIAVLRNLARDRADGVRPRLAMALINLAKCSFDAGDLEEAEEALKEALPMVRSLEQDLPDSAISELGVTLQMTAAVASGLGRPTDALAASDECIAVWRRIVTTRPGAALAKLAQSLVDRSCLYDAMGRAEAALGDMEEAVQCCRLAVANHGRAFEFNLAASLSSYSARLSSVGQSSEAISAAEEAIALFTPLAEIGPPKARELLAHAFCQLASARMEAGRVIDALPLIERAVDMARGLAERGLVEHRNDLAVYLSNYAQLLSQVGRHDEALTACDEAMDDFRLLAEARPKTHIANLAKLMKVRSAALSGLDRKEEAIEALNSRVSMLREMAVSAPSTYLQPLAEALMDIGVALDGEVAVAANCEAIEALRGLEAEQPQRVAELLVRALRNAAVDLRQLDRPEEGIAALAEAADILRHQLSSGSLAMKRALLLCLRDLASQLHTLGRSLDALSTLDEAIAIAGNDGAFNVELTAILRRRMSTLIDLGRTQEARATVERLSGLLRQLSDTDPDTYLTDYAEALATVAELSVDCCEPGSGLSAAREAIVVLNRLSRDRLLSYADSAVSMLAHYRAVCRAAGAKVDEELCAKLENATR